MVKVRQVLPIYCFSHQPLTVIKRLKYTTTSHTTTEVTVKWSQQAFQQRNTAALKKAFNQSNTLLNHYTNGGVSNPVSPSSPANPSTSHFVFDRTTFSAGSCLAINDSNQSGVITITGYAYMKELTENPAQEYTLSSNLQFTIGD